jgi:hypothetical protein
MIFILAVYLKSRYCIDLSAQTYFNMACRDHRHEHPAKRCIDRVGGSQQGVMAQVSVTLESTKEGWSKQAIWYA